jgi:hypothetical protein
MNYSNPQQQALYSSALSPGHYGSPNHGKFIIIILAEVPIILDLWLQKAIYWHNVLFVCQQH